MENRMPKTATATGESEVKPVPDHIWQWVQEIGLAQILVIPFALLFAWRINLPGNVIAITLVLLIACGVFCLIFGYYKRCEIWDKEDN
jgi:hypothetical protein